MDPPAFAAAGLCPAECGSGWSPDSAALRPAINRTRSPMPIKRRRWPSAGQDAERVRYETLGTNRVFQTSKPRACVTDGAVRVQRG